MGSGVGAPNTRSTYTAATMPRGSRRQADQQSYAAVSATVVADPDQSRTEIAQTLKTADRAIVRVVMPRPTTLRIAPD
jgi:hypothetical protein